MPIKNVSVLWKITNSYSKVFFVHFRSFFVFVHGPDRVTVQPPPMKV